MQCYLDGQFFSQSELPLPITNLAFTRGYAAFELFRTYNFKPFYLKEHLQRFEKSSQLLLLEPPRHIEKSVQSFLENNPYTDLVVRLYLFEDESEQTHFLILCNKVVPLDPSLYTQGISVITTHFRRQFHLAKSTNYLAASVALKEAKKKQCFDAIFQSEQDELLELTKSNLFCVIGQTLYTANKQILSGITRGIVLQLAKKLSIAVKEQSLFSYQIPQIEEAFCTSTTREILPISKINETQIQTVGPITKRLQQAFSLQR